MRSRTHPVNAFIELRLEVGREILETTKQARETVAMGQTLKMLYKQLLEGITLIFGRLESGKTFLIRKLHKELQEGMHQTVYKCNCHYRSGLIDLIINR